MFNPPQDKPGPHSLKIHTHTTNKLHRITLVIMNSPECFWRRKAPATLKVRYVCWCMTVDDQSKHYQVHSRHLETYLST